MARWASIRCPFCKERIQLYTEHRIKIYRQWRRRESGEQNGSATGDASVVSGDKLPVSPMRIAAANLPPLQQRRRRDSGSRDMSLSPPDNPVEAAAANPPPLLGSVGTALRARKTRSSRGGP